MRILALVRCWWMVRSVAYALLFGIVMLLAASGSHQRRMAIRAAGA
jgi:hypothetical protein